MKKKMKTLATLMIIVGLTTTIPAFGATITVLNSSPYAIATPGVTTVGDPTTVTQAFSAGTGAEMLVVSTHADTYALTSLTYGGQSLTLAPASATSTNRASGIWYLANPIASGDLVATFTTAGSSGLTVGFGVASLNSSNGNAIALGTAGVATGDAATEPTLTLNVPQADSFVFLAVGANGANTSTNFTTAGVTELDIPVITSMGAAAGFDLDVAAGNTPAYAWTTSNNTASNSAVITGASFYVIPEPSTFVLFAGALLGLFILRRRR